MHDVHTSRLLVFLSHLRAKKIMFTLSQQRDEAIMVSFAFVGSRVEVEFFNDHIEFSTFEGDESVESDEKRLYQMIDERWDAS